LSEEAIQRAVIAHLAWRGVRGLFYCSIPNGGLRSRTEAARMKGTGTIAGAPDILIICGAKVYGLEIKRVGGRLSPAQRAVHARLIEAGCTVEIGYGLDESLRILEGWHLLRGSASLGDRPHARAPDRPRRLPQD
jgi:hypothetical protein